MSGKPSHSIIIANDLRTGAIVYFTQNADWSVSVTDAELLTEETSSKILAAALEDESNNLVIDPNLVAANISAGSALQPIDIRDQIRVSGPTILGSNQTASSQAA